MANAMSDEEFHKQTISAGGASRHAITGNVPDRGYMVGGAGIPEVKFPVDKFSVEDIQTHARNLRDHFGDGAQVHQGAWVEGDSVVLDASERMTRKREAIRTAKQRGERAIYDIKGQRDIPTGRRAQP